MRWDAMTDKVQLLGLIADGATIREHDGLRTVHLGLPLNWVEQDHSRLDPPRYPVDEGFLNPANYPTSLHGGYFLFDILLLAAFLYGLYELCRHGNRYLETTLNSMTEPDPAAHR